MLKHVLTPRMKASHVAIDAMKDHLDAVYDITVAYEGTLTADGQRRPAPSMPGTLVMFLSQIFVWPTENCNGKNAGTGCLRPAIIQTCEFPDTSCKQATRALFSIGYCSQKHEIRKCCHAENILFFTGINRSDV